VSWPTHAVNARQEQAYQLACVLLEHTAYPYLHKRLIEGGMAVDSTLNYSRGDLSQGVELVLWSTLGQDLSELEDEVYKTFATFAATVTPVMVAERLRWTHLSLMAVRADCFVMAGWLGWFLHRYGDAERWDVHVESLLAVTADDVRAAVLNLDRERAGVFAIRGRLQR